MDDVPTWMTRGKTTSILKDKEKRNAANNYHSIRCLLLMRKLLTIVLTGKSKCTPFSEECDTGWAEEMHERLMKKTWRTKLIACNESLGEVDIKSGIFQGDSFSLQFFVVFPTPLAIILNETDLGNVYMKWAQRERDNDWREHILRKRLRQWYVQHRNKHYG